MKRFVAFVLGLATLLVTSVACHKTDDVSGDYASIVSGVYTGKLQYGVETIRDAYVVTIGKVSNTVVTMTADFLQGSANFNVVKNGSTYSLVSETVWDINTTISGKDIVISYQTTGNYFFTFTGRKD